MASKSNEVTGDSAKGIVIPTSQDKMASEDQQEKDKAWVTKYSLGMDQLTEIKESFAVYDKNGEGMINAHEVSSAIRALGQNPTEKECSELLQEIDLNDMGKVSLDEFVRVVGQRGLKSEPEMEEELEEALRVFDKDGMGYCEADELRNVLRTLGEPVDDDDIADMLKVAEVDREGKLNYLEFARKMTAK